MEYRTIAREASDEFTEKRSRFIGYIKPVTTKEQAVNFINEIRAKHWDATHNVYAYILRDGQTQRYSDDGEPQGTAGIPVLDVLRKENVTDCVVVATRYFGGILLGGGGLVRAYSHTAKIALDAGGIVTMRLCAAMRLTCDYALYGKVSTLIPACGGVIDDTEFGEAVTLSFHIPAEAEGQFAKQLTECSLGQLAAEKTGELFC